RSRCPRLRASGPPEDPVTALPVGGGGGGPPPPARPPPPPPPRAPTPDPPAVREPGRRAPGRRRHGPPAVPGGLAGLMTAKQQVRLGARPWPLPCSEPAPRQRAAALPRRGRPGRPERFRLGIAEPVLAPGAHRLPALPVRGGGRTHGSG